MLADLILSAGQISTALLSFIALSSPVAWWVYRYTQSVLVMLRRIEAEFRPNGGGSIRDALVRLERDVERIYTIKRVMIDLSESAAFETDGAGDCVWASAGYMSLVGRPWADLSGDGWTIVIHQDDRDKVFAEWSKAVERHARFEMAYRYVNRTGVSTQVQVIAIPIPGGYYGTVLPHGSHTALDRSAQIGHPFRAPLT